MARAAREAGLLVLADGKRGDVPHTAAAYAQALLGATETPWGTVDGLGADAVTANPLLGRDSLEPHRRGGPRRARPGCSCSCAPPTRALPRSRTSPPAGRRCATGWRRSCASWARTVSGAAGLSDVGAVVAATEPALIAELRARMPHAVFLLPGVGAQGGRVEDAGAGLRRPAGPLRW